MVVSVTITYPMIGYCVSVFKVSWYSYVMFCSLLYFNYMGTLLVSLAPNFVVSGHLASPIYIIFNLSMNDRYIYSFQNLCKLSCFTHWYLIEPCIVIFGSYNYDICMFSKLVAVNFCSKFQSGGYGCIMWLLHVGPWMPCLLHNMET